MILSILIVNDVEIDLSEVKKYFKQNFCRIIETNSIEDALRIVGRQHLDLVMLTLSVSNDVYLDFLSVLRITLGASPLIGIADGCDSKNFPLFADRGVDDIVYSNSSKQDLFRTIHALSGPKEKMCTSCLMKNNLGRQTNKKVVIFSEEKLNIFDDNFLKDTTVVDYYKQENKKLSAYSLSDVFVVDINVPHLKKLCADLKLNRDLHYKPIFLVTGVQDKKKATNLYNQNIGIMDLIYKGTNPSIISCKVNAHIKYKRLLDEFYHEVKKNIYMSSVDTVTTVYNRGFLEDYIDKREDALHNSAVLMVDLDKFKSINDKYGHAFADKVLNEVVSYIKSYIRLTDLIARYGGDEFLILMRNISRSEIERVAKRLIHNVKNKLFNGIKCTISIGICYVSSETVKLRKAIYVADSFMYIAKKAGGNSFYLC